MNFCTECHGNPSDEDILLKTTICCKKVPKGHVEYTRDIRCHSDKRESQPYK